MFKLKDASNFLLDAPKLIRKFFPFCIILDFLPSAASDGVDIFSNQALHFSFGWEFSESQSKDQGLNMVK